MKSFTEHTMSEAEVLADRYVAVWNNSDPAQRKDIIHTLWAPEGTHYMGTKEARGYAALEERIKGSHERNVRDGGYLFRLVKTPQSLRNVATFNWEMYSVKSGEIAAEGSGFLILDERGRILTDYLFTFN
jgi:hypothetical protein